MEETSLIPEIKLDNKLKSPLKALLLPLLSIHVKPPQILEQATESVTGAQIEDCPFGK